MSYTVEQKKNEAIITITIPVRDVEKGMQQAAQRLSEETTIPGFRPGKATYEAVKQRVGEMKLLEEATEELIRAAFLDAILKEHIDTVGQPYFDMVQMAPGNDLIFTATVALMPKVKKMANYEKLSVKAQSIEPDDKMLEQALNDLAMMQTKEVRAPKETALKKGDKAVVNLTMKRDGVVLEGGEGRDHGIYTGQTYYVEGFVDQIVGMKEGETKTFTLTFDKDHYQKHLAGQAVEFTVELKELFHLESPEMNDVFAKSLGLKDKAELDAKIKENLQKENEMREAGRQDQEVLELLANKSTFEEIPDILINQEIEKMLQELEHSIAQRGSNMDTYLKSINKTMAQMKLDMATPALTRVKIAILLMELAQKKDLDVSEKDLDEQLDALAEQYENNEDAKMRIYSPQYRDFLKRQMLNRKVIDHLKEKMVA